MLQKSILTNCSNHCQLMIFTHFWTSSRTGFESPGKLNSKMDFGFEFQNISGQNPAHGTKFGTPSN